MAIQSGYVQHVAKTVATGKAVGQQAGMIGQEIKHAKERVEYIAKNRTNQMKVPAETQNLNKQIDFALLSKKAYENSRPNREAQGFQILDRYSSPDRVVYQHDATGKVIIAFRGTDLHRKSNTFRDVTSDVLLGLGMQDLSHRFYNSEHVTGELVRTYGKQNVIATGHSLGGSQAMHVSNKFGIHAEVYNPHITWQEAMTHANFFNVGLHVNKTDPVAAFYPWATFQSVDARINKKEKLVVGQHGIDNFLFKTVPAKPKEAPAAFIPNGISRYMNRPPEQAVKAAQESMTPHHPAYLDCSRMPMYMQIQYGCQRKRK